MLLVNYWDSTICTLELLPDGKLGRRLAQYDPKEGRAMKARADTHVNQALNDENAAALLSAESRAAEMAREAAEMAEGGGCMCYSSV